MSLPHEVFVVASSRSDGRLPGAEKVLDGKIHLDPEAAEAAHADAVRRIGPHYGIYQAVLALESRLDADYVVDAPHVERGLTVGGLKEDDLLVLLEEIYRMGADDAGREDELLDTDQAKDFLEGYVADRLTRFASGDDDYTTRPGIGF